MIDQLSIFAENKKGTMRDITRTLSEAGINITALITNDSAEFGIVRMLVTDPELAARLLQADGYLCRLDQVIGVNISDEPGSLAGLLTAITDSNINVEYLYISYDRAHATPIAILQAAGAWEVEDCLRSRGYDLLQK
ncbi:MAG: ACT domain-containing protein [Eubacterium sp.]|nr:ACT domain-containing protein [Eubacterium sp.]